MKIIEGREQQYAKYAATNSADGYSKAIVDYGEKWAELMEKRIPTGATGPQITRIFVDHADSDSHEADTDGITGFMYGCAVQALACFWIHGEELRHWHNLKTQIRNEGEKANKTGGVLNPALLKIGGGDAGRD